MTTVLSGKVIVPFSRPGDIASVDVIDVRILPSYTAQITPTQVANTNDTRSQPSFIGIVVAGKLTIQSANDELPDDTEVAFFLNDAVTEAGIDSVDVQLNNVRVSQNAIELLKLEAEAGAVTPASEDILTETYHDADGFTDTVVIGETTLTHDGGLKEYNFGVGSSGKIEHDFAVTAPSDIDRGVVSRP